MKEHAPKPGERYRHYKGGEYEILALGQHTETKEALVVYRSLKYGSVWARPQAIFEGTATKDGVEVERFELIQGVNHECSTPISQKKNPGEPGGLGIDLSIPFPGSHGVGEVS